MWQGMTQWQRVLCVKGRPTTVSEDQRTAQQWTVKVDGTELKKLESGESVEIGRKPLRPLMDDGFARLDIMDANKSMSKRHAIFSVDAQGNASVRDLKSTNGSFVVADNGQLMRLPADEDFQLPTTPTCSPTRCPTRCRRSLMRWICRSMIFSTCVPASRPHCSTRVTSPIVLISCNLPSVSLLLPSVPTSRIMEICHPFRWCSIT